MKTTTQTRPGKKSLGWRVSAMGVVLLAFALRLRYLTLFYYHIDEFYSLAAAKLIAETGVPRYPSGLMYIRGLPFSYLDGMLFWGLGFSEALGRWPAALFGVLSVATLYWLGVRVLRSPGVGVLAALWLALEADSVAWGGRARMTTLAQWLVLLSVGLLWVGLSRPSTRHRLLFIASFAGAMVSHFAVVVLIPAWLASAASLWRWRLLPRRRAIVRDAGVWLAVCGLVFLFWAAFHPPPTVEFQQRDRQTLSGKIGALENFYMQFPPDLPHAWKVYGGYFRTSPRWPLLALTVISGGLSLRRVASKRGRKSDAGAVFLLLLFVTALAVLAGVISPNWQRTRYLLIQSLGIFFLLAGHGLWEGVECAARRVGWRGARRGAMLVGGLALALLFVPPLRQTLRVGVIGWNRYDLAFRHVRDTMDASDAVMTMHPPAALIYTGRPAYYLDQTSAKLLLWPDGSLRDYYTGALWLKTVDDFDRVLDGPQRVWLVTQEFWLFNSYDGLLQQEILWRMDKKWGEGGVWALVSRPGAWPLARSMTTPLAAEFEGGTRLLGFTADPPALRPGASVRLTLFWVGDRLPFDRKVFVHLRDAANNTVAQADHFLYDGKVPSSRWDELLSNDTAIRDGATLLLPPDLPPGDYRLLVGFYHPETFERLGVVNDQSGEAAVVLGAFGVE